jgi:uncharacterized protein (DUF433 family)
MSEETQKKEVTNHPFIVRKKEICDGSPIIEGTRTRVIDMAIEYEALGHSPDEIIDNHPYLDLSQVHDALSYYYENRDELDRKIEHDKEFTRQLKKMFPSKIEKICEQD